MDHHLQPLRAAMIVLVMSAVAWPALFNGQPFYFSDTGAYVRGADAGIERATGISSAWSRSSLRRPSASEGAPSPGQGGPFHESLSSIEDRAVLSGRSVYYGALLYLGYVGGEFWLVVTIQTLLLVLACLGTLRACQVPEWPYAGVVVALTSVTPAAFFVSFAMPDIFAALAILACAVLISIGRNLPWRDRIFWFLLLTFALLTHSAFVLVVASMLLIATVVRFALRRDSERVGPVLVMSAVAIALLGEVGFTTAVTRILGAPPLRPPFLMARTIEDGPGFNYLLETCPQSGFVVCRFKDRLPLAADEVLWSRDPKRGVFAVVDPDTRRLLSQEQVRFFMAVLRFDLLGQARASIRNSFRQATLLGIPEFSYPEKRKREFEAKLPPQNAARMRSTAAYQGQMPIRTFSMLSYVLGIAGTIYLAYVSLSTQRNAAARRLASMGVAWLIVLGVTLNAIVAGSLSTPHHRYQARVIWLIPIIALIVDFGRRQQWWRRRLERGHNLIRAS
jgi:hypothetical protein